MASRTRSLNQDNRFGFPFSGKLSSMSNVQDRQLLGRKTDGSMKPRRRPLQELNCKNLENLTNSVKAVDMAAKPNQDKVKKNGGGRRALGDLTNSSKLLQRGVKNGSSSLKLPSVAEEGCLHDHRECAKAQRHAAMDMDCFLETVGLGKDCCSTPIVSPKFPPSTTSKLESPARLEFDCYGTLSPTASPKLESPVRHLDQDVDMLQLGMEWVALDFCCGFKMDSPSK